LSLLETRKPEFYRLVSKFQGCFLKRERNFGLKIISPFPAIGYNFYSFGFVSGWLFGWNFGNNCRLSALLILNREVKMQRPDELTEMIVLCRQGRSQGYAWLIQEYGPRLFSYFRQVSQSPTEAEDLVQEFFVKFIRAIGEYRDQQRFEHWLFRIAANLARDRVRTAGRRIKMVPLNEPFGRDEPLPATIPISDEPAPGHGIERKEAADQLHDALATMPPLDREMILLRHYGGLSFKEIALQTNLPLGTVLSRVHRGLKQLKRILEHEENG
jgi:RNA polymerase sigma-70 factor, ECF subfamily